MCWKKLVSVSMFFVETLEWCDCTLGQNIVVDCVTSAASA